MRERSRSDCGAAAVEFALVLPVLLLIVFGIIQFGVAFAQVLALNSAARQGARVGVTGGQTCSAVDSAARAASQTLGIGPTEAAKLTVTIMIDPTSSAPTAGVACSGGTKPCAGALGEPLLVTVSHSFGFSVPLPFVTPSANLEGTGEYRCESNF